MIELKLVDILPPVRGHGEKVDWIKVEKELNLRLPNDYKFFVEAYGLGWIDDFIMVLTPKANNYRHNIVLGSVRWLDNYQSSKDSFSEVYQHHIYDGKNGIFPWAVTNNADVLYWLFKDHEIKETVVYGARGGEFYSTHLSSSCFLYQLLTKQIICHRFPDDFPSAMIEFTPVA